MAITSRTAESSTATSPPTASAPVSPLPLIHVAVLLQPVQATLLQGRLAGPDHSPMVDHSQRLVIIVVDCLLSVMMKECNTYDHVTYPMQCMHREHIPEENILVSYDATPARIC